MYQLGAQNATILIHFIATAKMIWVTKSIFAVYAIVSLLQPGLKPKLDTLVVPFVAELAFFTTTTSIIQTSVALIRAVTILSLLPSQL